MPVELSQWDVTCYVVCCVTIEYLCTIKCVLAVKLTSMAINARVDWLGHLIPTVKIRHGAYSTKI